MSYKFSGYTSRPSKFIVINEDDWTIEKVADIEPGNYEVSLSIFGEKTVLTRDIYGKGKGYGRVVPLATYCDDSTESPTIISSLPDYFETDDNIEVTISGGCPPYTWTSDNPNFEWESNVTSGTTNTLTCIGAVETDSDLTIKDALSAAGAAITYPIIVNIKTATSIATGGPVNLIFYAFTNDCYSSGQTSEINIYASNTVVSVTAINTGCSSTGTDPVLLTTPAEYATTVSLSVDMVAAGYTIGGNTVTGNSVISVSKCVCVADENMEWDTAISATSIARSSNVTVAVTGGNGPFTWSVSGNGFSLTNTNTDGLSNTLNSNGAACGSATITCIGCDGKSVTGYVRCLVYGTWNYIGDPEGYCHHAPTGLSQYTYEKFGGKYRSRGREYCSSNGDSYSNTCCATHCFGVTAQMCDYCAGFEPDRITNLESWCDEWGC